jgi:septum formation protein
LILASASVTRQRILEDAGVDAMIEPAQVDEGAIKESMAAEGASAIDAALILAQLKAQRISARHQGALVIGADQVLDLAGHWFDKPVDMDHAKDQWQRLLGRTHGLATAACVFRDGEQIWHHMATPELTMREFSDSFLDDYLAQSGASILTSVGAYRLESEGVHLFNRIEGDYFTILGLALLPLLDFLRGHGVVKT